MKKVVFCIPSLHGPTKPLMAALEASAPLLTEAGWDHNVVEYRGNPYISFARADMLRKALDAKADVIVFIDYDVSWRPGDLLKLVETKGDVVAGFYRYKKAEEEYMGALITDEDGLPQVRADGALRGYRAPAGYLKITKEAVTHFMRSYPELIYGVAFNPCVDLFNHGAHKGIWYGEDMAFCRRWLDCGGELWIVPDLELTHWSGETPYVGNYHEFLMRQPGGCKAPVEV